MDRRVLQILRIVFYAMLAWFVVSTLGRFHWLLTLLVTAFAISNIGVIWMLREHRQHLAAACRRPFIRRYVGCICFFTRDQIPPEYGPNSRSRALRLRTERDFLNAAEVSKQVVRGHNGVVDRMLSRIYENQTLRRTRRTGIAGPLASFLVVGEDGIGKRYFGRVLSKLLYGSGAIEIFDCSRLTIADVIGTKDRCGDLLEIVRKQPHSLVLFERIEKASGDTANLLIQLLTSGKLCQPGSSTHVSFEETVVVFSTTKAASSIVGLPGSEIGDAAWEQRAIELIGDATQIDGALLSAVTDVCFFSPPSDLVKAEVVALLMKKECKAHDIELSYVAPEILATQVFQINNGTGFKLVPQRIRKLLRKPLVAAAPQRPQSIALRIHEHATNAALKV